VCSSDLAALGVPAKGLGDVGWRAKVEYATAADLAAPPARNVALSIFANDLDGRRVFTARTAEGFSVSVSADTPKLATDVRDTLDKVSGGTGAYAFLEHGSLPRHSASDAQRDAALRALAAAGWRLYAAIISRSDRRAIADDLAADQQTITIAHSLLENVLPWAAIYDRPYDEGATEDDRGQPVKNEVCSAGLPGADGRFRSETCGAHPDCPLSAKGR
jgi:hypothetical protein